MERDGEGEVAAAADGAGIVRPGQLRGRAGQHLVVGAEGGASRGTGVAAAARRPQAIRGTGVATQARALGKPRKGV